MSIEEEFIRNSDDPGFYRFLIEEIGMKVTRK